VTLLLALMAVAWPVGIAVYVKALREELREGRHK
jgi:hypothetical protein